MRLSLITALCWMSPTALLALHRYHIKDLYEVVRTYATYHNFMRCHPEILYRYGPSDGGENTTYTTPQMAPKLIHQIYLQEGRNSTLHEYADALASCHSLHPSWQHRLWTDDNGTEFIREHYPSIAPHYEGYGQSIQRANILRYALLDHFGGVYMDLDVTCLGPLDNLLHLPLLTPGAYPAGVNNAFILARPHHGFVSKLLQQMARHDLSWPLPYVENMLSTGCMFFTNRWMDYVRDFDRLLGTMTEEDKVYTLADQDGNMEPHMLRGKITTPLFAHGGASSWHGWDAAVIVFIGKHYAYFLMLMVGSTLVTVALVCRLARGGDAGGTRSGWEKREDEERLFVGKDG